MAAASVTTGTAPTSPTGTPGTIRLAVVAPNGAGPDVVEGQVVVNTPADGIRLLDNSLKRDSTVSAQNGLYLKMADRVGQGAWSVVYHMLDLVNDAECALKMTPYHGHCANGATADVATLRRFDHRNIIKCHLHFRFRLQNVPFLCLKVDYCAKGSLAEVIRRKQQQKGTVSTAKVCSYVAQIASALAYIHQLGMLHGDLRSANVLITAYHVVKLDGFGCGARMPRSGEPPLTVTGGARAYVPPEWVHAEALGRPLTTAEQPLSSYDLWGLGCVLSELATMRLLEDRLSPFVPLASDKGARDAIATELATAHGGQFAALGRGLLHMDPDERLTAPAAAAVVEGSVAQGRRSTKFSRILRPFGFLRPVPFPPSF
eukprot:EG_transcript_11125